ncbi:hypothetical protein QW060_19790 [Myroides ceti]|uniref:Uncharacterized protein n=2 Tax=Paenimyroides ceti TaxID=395087 RepID=A0ABT8CXM5_9FLAO|nr:hypothetical protein [Paenimyroides ceti]MDN3709265.1 hypothetical protein [Paenimyroides ceti]
MKKMIPSYGKKLSENLDMANEIRKYNAETLGLIWKEIDTNKYNMKVDQ